MFHKKPYLKHLTFSVTSALALVLYAAFVSPSIETPITLAVPPFLAGFALYHVAMFMLHPFKVPRFLAIAFSSIFSVSAALLLAFSAVGGVSKGDIILFVALILTAFFYIERAWQK